MNTPAGWYPDPRDTSTIRWWDGATWTAHTQARPPAETDSRATSVALRDATAPPGRMRPGLSTFITAGILLLLFISCALTGNIGSGIALLGLGGVVTGLYVTITGRRSWAVLHGRKLGALTLVGAFIVICVGAVVQTSMHPGSAADRNAAANSAASPDGPTVVAPAAPTPDAAPVPTSTPLSEGDKEIMDNAGKEGSVTSTLTLAQAKSLLANLAKIHPDLAKPRELRDARSTCYDIQQGADEATLVKNTGLRFGNGSTRIFNEAQSAQILKEIRDNGFCKV